MTARISRPSVRKADVAKVVEAFRANGITPCGAEIAPDGTVRVFTSDGASKSDGDAAFNEWSRRYGKA
jgi:hypothetical protein